MRGPGKTVGVKIEVEGVLPEMTGERCAGCQLGIQALVRVLAKHINNATDDRFCVPCIDRAARAIADITRRVKA